MKNQQWQLGPERQRLSPETKKRERWQGELSLAIKQLVNSQVKKDIRKTNLGGNQAKRWTITGKKGGSTNQSLLFEPVFRSLGGGRGEEQSCSVGLC